MDKIDDVIKKRKLNAIIKSAATNAMKKLKKYYKNTNAFVYTVSMSMINIFFFYLHVDFILLFCILLFSNVLMFLIIFLVLDPRLKIAYCYDHNWEQKFILEAMDDITKLYNGIYAPTIDPNAGEDDNTAADEDDLLSHIYKK
jgi:hypothetical protein